jgi:hypothetical protein
MPSRFLPAASGIVLAKAALTVQAHDYSVGTLHIDHP